MLARTSSAASDARMSESGRVAQTSRVLAGAPLEESHLRAAGGYPRRRYGSQWRSRFTVPTAEGSFRRGRHGIGPYVAGDEKRGPFRDEHVQLPLDHLFDAHRYDAVDRSEWGPCVWMSRSERCIGDELLHQGPLRFPFLDREASGPVPFFISELVLLASHGLSMETNFQNEFRVLTQLSPLFTRHPERTSVLL